MLDLIIGGARSGKTKAAERLAAQAGLPVVYLATSIAGDDEFRARIEAHRRRRPPTWELVEEPYRVAEAIAFRPGTAVIVDCLGMYVTNLLFAPRVETGAPPAGTPAPNDPRAGQQPGDAGDREAVPPGVDTGAARIEQVLDEVRELADAGSKHDGAVIVVSNEVGQGVIPAYPLGRVFRDVLGEANQIMADSAVRVFLMTAGIAVNIKAVAMRDGFLRGDA